jgi:hypothetical protein
MGEIERKTKENSQRTPRYRDPTCSPLLEMILIGGNVHIDLLSLLSQEATKIIGEIKSWGKLLGREMPFGLHFSIK